jgi:hypothetical protein
MRVVARCAGGVVLAVPAPLWFPPSPVWRRALGLRPSCVALVPVAFVVRSRSGSVVRWFVWRGSPLRPPPPRPALLAALAAAWPGLRFALS